MDKQNDEFQKKIEERRQLLIELHKQNQEELKHPSLITEDDEPIHKECQDFGCLIKKKETMSKKEYYWAIATKFLIISAVLLVIIALLMIGYLITKRVA
ncbi:hypothetical protein ACJA25_01780 [Mycoplasmopsis hyopharyngis]|uniref:hypothetical protein n=1 Tax=Mycoplasmopsis hyopharyngis TaxID=29558 RepID=UPI003872D8CF